LRWGDDLKFKALNIIVRLTLYSFPFHFREGQTNVFRNMLVYWGWQLKLSKHLYWFKKKKKEKRDKTICRKYWSSLSSDKFLTSAFTEKNLHCKTYRMCENSRLQKQL